MTVFVPAMVGFQEKTAAFGAVLLLVMVATDGPLGSVHRSELLETLFVTDAVSVNVVPNEIFVSLIGLSTSGPVTWECAALEQNKSMPTTKTCKVVRSCISATRAEPPRLLLIEFLIGVFQARSFFVIYLFFGLSHAWHSIFLGFGSQCRDFGCRQHGWANQYNQFLARFGISGTAE